MKKIPLISSILLAAGLASPVSTVMAYEAGDWLIRGRVINVNPNDSSGTLSLNGADTGLKGVKVDSDTVTEPTDQPQLGCRADFRLFRTYRYRGEKLGSAR